MAKNFNSTEKKHKQKKSHLQRNLHCPICKSTELTEYNDAARRFFRCRNCESVFVDPECFLKPDEQSARYLLHQNVLEPAEKQGGYRYFLTKFADTALGYVNKLSEEHKATSIFDYGSGPEPSLMYLLEEYKASGRLSNATEIRGWDPFFAPDTMFFENGADLVLCLEVAEHFETPIEDFKGLARSCSTDGIIALQTILVPKTRAEFKNWWYKEDTTHVTFYSKYALELCAKNAGLVLEAHIDAVFFFRKILRIN